VNQAISRARSSASVRPVPRRARLVVARSSIHLRSDSAPARKHLVGRVEHVKSGDSEQFASLEALLAFVDRHMVASAEDRDG
jgi:hypothetical protein